MDENQMEAAREKALANYRETWSDSSRVVDLDYKAGYQRGWNDRGAANEWVRIVPKEVSKIQLRDGTHIYLDHGHGGWRIRSTRLGIDDEIVYTTLDDALDVVREKQSEMAELGYAEYQPATNGEKENL